MLATSRAAAVVALAGATACADVLGIHEVPTPGEGGVVVFPLDASSVDGRADSSIDASIDAGAGCTGCGSAGCGDACAPCVPNVSCEPSNPCHLGLTSCASGHTSCVDTLTNVGSGQVCATYRGGTCQSGSCLCPAGTALCATACVDLASDPRNCGLCGHDCRAGGCDAGACQPFAVVTHTELVALQVTPMSIVSDGTNLYYSSDTYQLPGLNQVWTASAGVAGSIPQRLAASQPSLNDLALGPQGLYWSNYGTSASLALYSITNDGAIDLWPGNGGVAPVVSPLQNPGNLVIDAAGTYGYFPSLGPYDGMGGTDRTRGFITQVNLATGATRQVVTGINMLIPYPNQVAVAGPYLYWLVGNPPFTTGVTPLLVRAAIADGVQESADHFLTDVDNGLAPVASDTAVYWLTSNGQSSTPAGGVFTLPITAGFGTLATPLATNQNNPNHLAIDSTYAYWSTAPVDAGGVGAILRAPLDASRPATHVADTGALVYAIALDATSLYWTDTVNGIVQLAKPLP